jgi:hypothetical protein
LQWVARFLAKGRVALVDRSFRPACCPRAIDEAKVPIIVGLSMWMPHLLTAHRGPTDDSPLPMISTVRVACYHQLEVDYLKLRASLALEPGANERSS